MSEMLQEKKNTVSSANQLGKYDKVRFHGGKGSPKVMFVGNSITRHGPLASIGWIWDFGMAASCAEKDYVHVTSAAISEKYPDASFCVCQMADWERNVTGCNLDELFLPAKEFAADVIIYRIGENIPNEDYSNEKMQKGMELLFAFLTANNPDAKIVFTTNFWANKAKDDSIAEYAEKNGYKAPIFMGDLGMKTIAERILPDVFEAIESLK